MTFLTVPLNILDHAITFIQQTCVPCVPRIHPACIELAYNLAELRFARFQLSHEKEDVDKSIVHCTEAILLRPHHGNVFQILSLLANSLLERSRVFGQPDDIKYAIEYLRYLRGLPVDPFNVPRIEVTTSLIEASATQLEFVWDRTHNIDEMKVLFRELLTSNLSVDIPDDTFDFLIVVASDAAFHRGHVESLDAVIECLRDVVNICPPDSLLVLYPLASMLKVRFIVRAGHSNDDYEESMALLERIEDSSKAGECPDSIRNRNTASAFATMLAFARSTFFNNPEYTEVAISRLRTELDSFAGTEDLEGNSVRLDFAKNLVSLVNDRYTEYNLSESLEEAESYATLITDLSSSESFEASESIPILMDAVLKSYSITDMTEKIQEFEKLLSTTPSGTKRYSKCIAYLAAWYSAKSNRTDDMSDLEEAIKYCRLQLEAVRPIDLDIPLKYLQVLLFHAFEKTKKISHLEESITAGYDILKLRTPRRNLFDVVCYLVGSLLAHEKLLPGRREYPNEAIRLILTVIDAQYAQESARFILSYKWADIARAIRHPTTLAAYETAMSSMQKSLSFAPTVSLQHTCLVALGPDLICATIPLDFASFHIDFGRLEKAVEILEQGRAMLWSEMRGLRAPVTQLVDQDSPLAKRFAEINRELEALTVSIITPSGRPEMKDGDPQGGDGTDPFGRLVIKRRKLVEERNTIVSKIQGLPGFEGFLRAPSFATLRSAASRGPVIFINHSWWRSDILIVFHNHLPCSIPTARDFYDRANTLRDELAEARKYGLDSMEYQDALCSVLKVLYELVGESVIKTLQVSGVPEQSRIWWCPTSVFCSLPLHAMGPIPSSDSSRPRYFSDLYIPSYTPSLSALIESRRETSQILEESSLLLVAHPEDSLPGVKGEIKVIKRALKARVKMTSLVSSESTPSSVIEGLRRSRFAHFACHGVLETGKPFEASFKLYAHTRLTLLDIARSRLPDAEFAFLSCCHAAAITEDSIEDEALHLTAAMQYCGFRSVVGTMWAMADADGEDLANNFYESLFSSRETNVPYYERSAHALIDATQKLRRRRGIKLERWVNFVHYGA